MFWLMLHSRSWVGYGWLCLVHPGSAIFLIAPRHWREKIAVSYRHFVTRELSSGFEAASFENSEAGRRDSRRPVGQGEKFGFTILNAVEYH